MPYRTLGKTDVKVSAIGLGGFHLGLSHLEEPDAIKIFRAAVDRGINFSDNSWDYKTTPIFDSTAAHPEWLGIRGSSLKPSAPTGGPNVLWFFGSTVKIKARYRGWGIRDLAAEQQYSCAAGGTSLRLSPIVDVRRTAPSRNINECNSRRRSTQVSNGCVG